MEKKQKMKDEGGNRLRCGGKERQWKEKNPVGQRKHKQQKSRPEYRGKLVKIPSKSPRVEKSEPGGMKKKAGGIGVVPRKQRKKRMRAGTLNGRAEEKGGKVEKKKKKKEEKSLRKIRVLSRSGWVTGEAKSKLMQGTKKEPAGGRKRELKGSTAEARTNGIGECGREKKNEKR